MEIQKSFLFLLCLNFPFIGLRFCVNPFQDGSRDCHHIVEFAAHDPQPRTTKPAGNAHNV